MSELVENQIEENPSIKTPEKIDVDENEPAILKKAKLDS